MPIALQLMKARRLASPFRGASGARGQHQSHHLVADGFSTTISNYIISLATKNLLMDIANMSSGKSTGTWRVSDAKIAITSSPAISFGSRRGRQNAAKTTSAGEKAVAVSHFRANFAYILVFPYAFIKLFEHGSKPLLTPSFSLSFGAAV